MSLKIPGLADMHVHLRQDNMLKAVVPTVAEGGVSVAYVMVCNKYCAIQKIYLKVTKV